MINMFSNVIDYTIVFVVIYIYSVTKSLSRDLGNTASYKFNINSLT